MDLFWRRRRRRFCPAVGIDAEQARARAGLLGGRYRSGFFVTELNSDQAVWLGRAVRPPAVRALASAEAGSKRAAWLPSSALRLDAPALLQRVAAIFVLAPAGLLAFIERAMRAGWAGARGRRSLLPFRRRDCGGRVMRPARQRHR